MTGGSNVNETNSDGMTLLHLSILSNDSESALFLIESGGADVNLRSNEGKTCLELSIKLKMLSIIDILCRSGADMSLSSTSDPPLWVALTQDQETDSEAGDIAAILVRHGVDTDVWVEGPDDCEQNLLHRAIGTF